MQPCCDNPFDFEQWAALARADPAAFEARRAEAIDALIAAAPPQRQARLRGLQWLVEMIRGRAANPLAACIKIFNRMWDSVYGERGLLEALQAVDGPPLPQPTSGDVVELQPPGSTRRPNNTTRPSSHP